jgi:hypothetical protein
MEEVEVTIVGEANAPIQILYRTHSDPLPEPVYRGNFGENGRLIVSIPRGYYVILSPGFETEPLDLETGSTTQNVRLKALKP